MINGSRNTSRNSCARNEIAIWEGSAVAASQGTALSVAYAYLNPAPTDLSSLFCLVSAFDLFSVAVSLQCQGRRSQHPRRNGSRGHAFAYRNELQSPNPLEREVVGLHSSAPSFCQSLVRLSDCVVLHLGMDGRRQVSGKKTWKLTIDYLPKKHSTSGDRRSSTGTLEINLSSNCSYQLSAPGGQGGQK